MLSGASLPFAAAWPPQTATATGRQAPASQETPQCGSPELTRLLEAVGSLEIEEAWTTFVGAYSAIIAHTCHKVVSDTDAAMDGYAYVLDALCEDGFRRLRAYVPQPGTRFTTWLVVVVRRLLLDHYRRRYGRSRSADASHREEHIVRRRLVNLVAAELDPEQITTPGTQSTDFDIRLQELMDALRRAIDELAPADRLLLTLRFDDGCSVRDVAETIHAPSVFHVYRRLDATLSALRRALARRGIESPDP